MNTQNPKTYFDTLSDWDHYKELTHDDFSCEIELSHEEQAAVLQAYDYGINTLTEKQRHKIDVILSKLKDQIHP